MGLATALRVFGFDVGLASLESALSLSLSLSLSALSRSVPTISVRCPRSGWYRIIFPLVVVQF